MARLTQDRIRRATEQIGEGWIINGESALNLGKLVPEFRVPDEGNPDAYTSIELRWDWVDEERVDDRGQRYRLPTGTWRPKLRFSRWHRSGGIWTLFGPGREIVLTEFEPTKRRTFATLARITRELTPEACHALAAPRTVNVDALLDEA